MGQLIEQLGGARGLTALYVLEQRLDRLSATEKDSCWEGASSIAKEMTGRMKGGGAAPTMLEAQTLFEAVKALWNSDAAVQEQHRRELRVVLDALRAAEERGLALGATLWMELNSPKTGE